MIEHGFMIATRTASVIHSSVCPARRHRISMDRFAPLSFSDSAQLFRELTPARLALLEHLKKDGPQSIYALAKQLGRNYSNVHADVRKLMEHHLIDKTEDQQVFVPWDDVEIHLSLSAVA